jgi:uncharacterized membrane protein
VFAIAATLLVLDIGVKSADGDDLLRALGDLWPAYLSYLTSFAAIGLVWLLHHWIVGSLKHVDTNLLRWNLLLLLLVAFLPFPTRLMAQFLGESDPERLAVVFYGLCLLLTKSALAGMWHYAARHPVLFKDDVSGAEIAAVGRLAAPNVVFILVATAVAVVLPEVAAALYCVIVVVSLARSR